MSNSNTQLQNPPKRLLRVVKPNAKQGNQLAKIVDQNQLYSLKLKRSGKIKGNLVDNKYKDISNPFPAKQELDDTLQLDDSRFDKTN